jgi:ubiquitin C-terminal hydrolase
MSLLILFYSNSQNLLHNIICNWDDNKLEQDDYINLFPDTIIPSDLNILITNKVIRHNIVIFLLRILNLYGFRITSSFQLEKIKDITLNKSIGLYSVKNYPIITNILNFINQIQMPLLSSLFFLAICKSLSNNSKLLYKVLKFNNSKYGALTLWIETQKYLKKNTDFPKLLNTILESNLENDCLNLKGLKYTGNSCYLDSTLFCLLSIKNNFIDEYVLYKNLNTLNGSTLDITCSDTEKKDIKIRKNIQDNLLDITLSIRNLYNVKTCSNLRKSLSLCRNREFAGTEQQDAGEFLLFLFQIFQVNEMISSYQITATNDPDKMDKTKNPTYKNWDYIGNIKYTYSSPIITIDISNLDRLQNRNNRLLKNGKHIKDTSLQTFLQYAVPSTLSDDNLYYPDKKLNPDEFYKYTINTKKLISSSYIVFNIARIGIKKDKYGIPIDINGKQLTVYQFDKFITIFNNFPITIPQNITVKKKNKHLSLSSIVIHSGGSLGGHYTCYFKCSDKWFFYDDNPSSINLIGSYNDVMNISKMNPKNNATLIFYT